MAKIFNDEYVPDDIPFEDIKDLIGKEAWEDIKNDIEMKYSEGEKVNPREIMIAILQHYFELGEIVSNNIYEMFQFIFSIY